MYIHVFGKKGKTSFFSVPNICIYIQMIEGGYSYVG